MTIGKLTNVRIGACILAVLCILASVSVEAANRAPPGRMPVLLLTPGCASASPNPGLPTAVIMRKTRILPAGPDDHVGREALLCAVDVVDVDHHHGQTHLGRALVPAGPGEKFRFRFSCRKE